MSHLLEPEIIREEIGQINILAVFRTEKPRMVIGGKIISGRLKKGIKFEVKRDGKVVGLGKITGLQKVKNLKMRLEKATKLVCRWKAML